jgi:hypothetical protein
LGVVEVAVVAVMVVVVVVDVDAFVVDEEGAAHTTKPPLTSWGTVPGASFGSQLQSLASNLLGMPTLTSQSRGLPAVIILSIRGVLSLNASAEICTRSLLSSWTYSSCASPLNASDGMLVSLFEFR